MTFITDHPDNIGIACSPGISQVVYYFPVLFFGGNSNKTISIFSCAGAGVKLGAGSEVVGRAGSEVEIGRGNAKL